MNVASLELCKALYELSGWKETFNCWEYSDGIPAGEPYLMQPELVRRYGLWGTQDLKKQYPAYDLGYLLRKLPIGTELAIEDDAFYFSYYKDGTLYGPTSKSPEDAAATLAIELFKQGILTKEVGDES